MGYLIGVDEAGYGPNLGPLVVSATVWQVPGDPRAVDLFLLLTGAVRRTCDQDSAGGACVTIDDSKAVYQPSQGLALLERGVLASLRVIGLAPATGHDLWDHIMLPTASPRQSLPWREESAPVELPTAAAALEIGRDADTLARGLSSRDVRLVMIRSASAFPAEFNAAVADAGNKAGALSRLTLQLVSSIVDELRGEDLLVVCDKHGGRNRYGALLQEVFPDWLVEVREEGREQSCYRWGPAASRVEARFCARGESHLPVALASMISKYLRELEMLIFNRFWERRVPNLRPTAGYPHDARRFKREIAAAQKALEIDDHLLWRCR